MARALRHKEISLIYPLSCIKPAFVAILAYFFLSESIGIKQIVGIGIILVSTYLLESDHHFSDFTKPLKNIISSKYNLYFVIAILIFSATTILDKYIVSNYLDISTYFFLSWIFIAINFNIVHLVEFGFKDTSACFKKVHYLPLLVGFFGFFANFFGLKALSMAYASLVPPILMLSTLFIVFFGGRFFHEKYIWFRVAISAVMLIGVYLIIM
jgi:drug/metabolite transporter (DMT)-like permease